ncbi:aminoglycoside phosphotransferase [Streptomyces harbinensis]
MPTSRIPFEELPPAVLDAVEKHAGTILKVEPVAEGLNSDIAARVYFESGSVYVKGLRASRAQYWTQRREVEVNPYVRTVAPAVLWEIETEGWHLIGFEVVNGHHADYSPDSPDLPIVADMLRRLSLVSCPDIPLKRAEQRLAKYVSSPAEAELFTGNALLHTDLNNANVLVSGRAHLVDWAWATRGAAWLDAGYWVVWLMAAGGHAAESAEQWASRVPAWHTATRKAIAAFAAANANVWEEIGGNEPDAWTARMLRASRDWSMYRERM